ncbi:MAG TPA: polysaccharide biosynthesis/export family protein [Burkholderiaceae bacterium]|jgi:polysaccharide export outer membrane protein|nr:polysaccharide biosynthesis/export family protein [Burkholderiaceae bacterium]
MKKISELERDPQGSRWKALCAAFLASLFLAACSMSPGVYMGTPEDVSRSLEEDGAPAGALKPITADLIRSYEEVDTAATRSAIQHLVGQAEPYRVGPGDILNIVVWNHPELALTPAGSSTTSVVTGVNELGNGYNVGPDGNIQFPFTGLVHVAGLNEFQIRDRLVQRLSGYISSPQITVRVQAYRASRIYVDGEVRNPGVLPITDLPMTLPEAINRAGGMTPEADRSAILLTRNGITTSIDLPQLTRSNVDPSSILLRNGDLLRVGSRENAKVYLMGDVFAPTAHVMHDGNVTLAQALGEAGGVNPESGDPQQVYVIRRGTDGNPEIFHMDAGRPASYVLAGAFQLKPRDIVFVDPAPIVRWNRVISNLLPSYDAVYTTRVMTR